jgi:hypothetical protein
MGILKERDSTINSSQITQLLSKAITLIEKFIIFEKHDEATLGDDILINFILIERAYFK